MAKQGHFEEHWSDAEGNPGGGVSSGRGFAISWQNGPLGQHNAACEIDHETGAPRCGELCTRREPNGAFVEDVLAAIEGRIRYYQDSRFASEQNEAALYHLSKAALALNERTLSRVARGVEGTHQR